MFSNHPRSFIFSLLSSSHKAVMDTEMEFLRRGFTQRNLKSIMDHVQRMAAGEAAFFPATLSLIYGELFQKALSEPATSGSLLGRPGGESVAGSAPAVRPRNSTVIQRPNTSAGRSSDSTYRTKFSSVPTILLILLYFIVYFFITAFPNASGK
jgi:hypothetical protein